jgi:hypothetical protein
MVAEVPAADGLEQTAARHACLFARSAAKYLPLSKQERFIDVPSASCREPRLFTDVCGLSQSDVS